MERASDTHDRQLAPRIGLPKTSARPGLMPDRIFGQQIAALVKLDRLHTAMGLIMSARSFARLEHAHGSLLQLSERLDSERDSVLIERVGQALACIESAKTAALDLPNA